ncbi:hypothetical protein A3H65_01590 [Candidatus Giovannonibacteria bacterium RIFCSPLOWO2_02_FULL_45_14]|uniref:UDP-N-acetylmuramoyl-tripeptide--D-alanyl-D-alanine ligase n=1 Tax=Candidatus Giovannonibacteria bacterium RIFCSPLOWO2_12_FULL_44_15 TaxID=1798364 RepID=A0A1F5XZH4_9BACT|nr:MAG: hypothetical protein A3C75_03490 [Candidatus Giovannonibacteria bacterium RIFCSPHIGHO2_02_FULL_44_31]OGF77083.1 MAG: hypothetical protein A3E62_02670 [Candidatus Giovannonibacteria bacterium RIFCSPHIGHO2_12_FULL_44_29]OGF90836.1 MAG: hypothetical protein A3H65_01590 [Candidatus Giovannonibacteria bacterium RIFCSPLOWO2_02_FULL_45_14]OGF93262.1 MAG: hypothetical protein A3G54_01505 [Candidatus Giovannonibacteria bacterium RIFCSPLOWO2_12_FULL_44_15]
MHEILKKIVVFVLTWEAQLILKKYKPKVVAVTGSVGKTSTKDAIAKVLEKKFRVRKSKKSYNSELGVPLAIIGAESGWDSIYMWLVAFWKGVAAIVTRENYPEILVLEVGADRPEDIKKIRLWLKPDVAVLTALAEIPVHVEFFSGPEEVFGEKVELIKGLDEKSSIILNFDDPRIMEMKDKTDGEILTYGFSEGADFEAMDYKIFFRREKFGSVPEGIEFKVKTKSEDLPVKIMNAFGSHSVYPALAAITVGSNLGMTLEDCIEMISVYSPPPGRLKLIRGVKETLILDDSYNSSPKALEAALKTLDDIKPPTREGRKIAVLGDMLELGKHTITAHRDLGSLAADVSDILCTVGVRAKFFMEGAIKEGLKKRSIYIFETSGRAGEELEKIIKPGDLLLIKGSQGMRMEKIVERLMAEPEKKKELLCRQDDGWENR